MAELLEIAFGRNRSDMNWKNEELTWDDFVGKLVGVRRTSETLAEYGSMGSNDRDKIKNGPAFVGGPVRGGRRLKVAVPFRWLLTLDADFANDDFMFTSDLILAGYGYAIYSTHSHRPDKQKYRLVIPVDRAMLPDEYAAVARRIASVIGMKYFDKTTFDLHRLMYLPSCSKDAEPILEIGEGAPLSVDSVLAEYVDWRDVSSWAKHPAEEKAFKLHIGKLEDPREKPHKIVAAFNRAYDIHSVISTFLGGVYAEAGVDRYTYLAGSSEGGLRVYPDKDDLTYAAWAFSEHESDPANDGHCRHAFDLVCAHKYADLEPAAATEAMLAFAAEDDLVKATMVEQIGEDFSDEAAAEPVKEKSWTSKLDIDKKSGAVLCTSRNLELILKNGSFKDVLAYDAFGNSEVIRGGLPWRARERPYLEYEPWLAADDRRMLHYFGKAYKFKSAATIQNAFTEVVHANTFHPIKEYLETQVWDGVPRLDRLFVRYLGAEDSHYVRSVTRAMLVAAVKRIYEPGCKFDEMLVLVGPQGAGKSTLIAKLGRKWFSDSLRSFDNKEAGEHLQGAWIFEIGELAVMKQAGVEEIKTFLSKTEDRYRVAYDRVVSEFPRKCVFFGTTNNYSFLNDPTGNRRFYPVSIDPRLQEVSHFDEFDDELVGLVWAEALRLYREGESLNLDMSATKEAERRKSVV